MVNYPIFLNLKGKEVLIVGGGLAASEKLPKLIKAEARITIISLSFNAEVKRFIEDNSDLISFEQRGIELEDLDGFFMIFSATDDGEKNKELVEYARGKNLLINSVDDPDNCDFYSMALLEKGSVALGFSSKGKFAGFSVLLKEIFDELLPDDDLVFMEELFELRDKLKEKFKPEERRRALLEILKSLKERYFS